MKLSEISKIDSAQKQLETAIKLFFSNGDPISIHTLASAAQEVIESLGKRKGIKSMKQKTLDSFSDEKRKTAIKKLSEAKNAFKHADRNPNEIVKLNPEYTELVIWDAVRLFYFITKKKIAAFICYDLWAYSKYPNLYKVNKAEMKQYEEALAGNSYKNKERFSNMLFDLEKEVIQNVKPDTSKLHFIGKDFENYSIEFTKETKVWSCYFTLNGQGMEKDDEGIIFNFYLNGVWGDVITPKLIAQIYKSSTENIIGIPFTAPDNITKEPAYIICSFKIQEEDTQLYLTKITSIRKNVFAVTYLKKIKSKKEDIENDVKGWIANDFSSERGASFYLANIGIDLAWFNFLALKNR